MYRCGMINVLIVSKDVTQRSVHMTQAIQTIQAKLENLLTDRPQLIAIDIDGTLLHDDHHLSERTKQALLSLQRNGCKCVLATGRSPISCEHLVEQLQLTTPLITHNGAVLYDPVTNKSHLEVGFQTQEISPLVDYCRKNALHFDMNTAFDVYVEQLTPKMKQLYKQFYMNPKVVKDSRELKDQIVKFTINVKKEQLDTVFEELVPLFPQLSILRSGDIFIDVIHPQATKGNALAHVIKHYGIDRTNVIAFGNYFNDLEMIELAGVGIAMENSPIEVKQKADLVTETNNNDGVALIVEQLLQR